MTKITQLEIKSRLPRKKNVAAYARVSCDKDTMLQSLCAQVAYFSDLIQRNKNWNYVGIYSDYGISGTKASRGDFDRLLEDVKAGKIDMVLVKSISRFARNLEVTLTWIRTLKAMDIDIFFELERIHTLSSDGELLISLLASSAQEQSRTASMNVLWKVKRNFEEGVLYGGGDCYGYRIQDKKFIVVPEQADVVRRVFRLYVEGNGDEKIARILNREGLRSLTGALWSRHSIRRIINNRNYTGDLLLQKTYTLDYVSKKTMRNNGEKDMYLVEGDHEPIVDRETFEQAQRIRQAKGVKGHKNAGTHAFTGLMVCGCCGKSYKFTKSPYHSKYMCLTYNDLGKDYCQSKAVPEEILMEETAKLLKLESFDEKKMRKAIRKMTVFNGNRIEVEMADGRVETIVWKDRSRSESWTPEMKERARRKTIERNGGKNNGKDNSDTAKG